MISLMYRFVILALAAALPASAQQIQSIHTPVMASLPRPLPPELHLKVLCGELLSHLNKKLNDRQAAFISVGSMPARIRL